MQKKEIRITFIELNAQEELSPDELTLLRAAEEASKYAYSPYSHYRVGSAVLLENGVIVSGNNQENMAFPSGLCAERVALFAASSNYQGLKINAVAISARSDDFPVTNPVTPCGACRQALIEYENNQGKPIVLILGSQSAKTYLVQSVGDLLPLSFKEEKLKK